LKKVELVTPIAEKDIHKLRIGDTVYVTGTMVTARDAAHKRMLQFLKEGKESPVTFEGLPLFHCGPLVKKVGGKWSVLAAGPTTSMRMEPYEDEVIKNHGVRLVIGKGGMGEKTRQAMKKYGAAYAVFTGGAAVLAAKHIEEVKGVEWLDLGTPEAVWVFVVRDFGPLVIAIDSEGKSLFEQVQAKAERNKARMLEQSGFQ